MQFRDLAKQYTQLKTEIDAQIADIIASGKFISGPQVTELEGELARYVGRKFCVTCANGTDALELVLRAWGIGSGDKVFVPSFTFMSTAEVVSILGAIPVFVDIDEATFNISPAKLEEAIIREGGGKAIIPVDLFGQPANYDQILPIAQKYGLKVLEDGAQGFGGAIGTRMACSFGDASTTSFFPAKPLGCYGDGGAIFTDNEDLAILLRSLCVHGKGKEKYENIRIGRNSRLDTIQAGILLPKLRAFQKYEIDAVNHIASRYTSALEKIVQTPKVTANYRSSWAQYTILLKNEEERTKCQAALKAASIPSMVYYPRPLHLQRAFAYLSYKEGDLPTSESICKRCLSLPMHPYMTDEEVDSITEILQKAIR